MNPSSDVSSKLLVSDRTEGMQMAVIGLDGVASLKDVTQTQKHTIWVTFDVSAISKSFYHKILKSLSNLSD